MLQIKSISSSGIFCKHWWWNQSPHWLHARCHKLVMIWYFITVSNQGLMRGLTDSRLFDKRVCSQTYPCPLLEGVVYSLRSRFHSRFQILCLISIDFYWFLLISIDSSWAVRDFTRFFLSESHLLALITCIGMIKGKHCNKGNIN